MMEKVLGVHHERRLPPYAHANSVAPCAPPQHEIRDGERTPGKVALYATCYVNYNEPGIGNDLLAILDHNGIPVMSSPRRRPAAACLSSSSVTSRPWRG